MIERSPFSQRPLNLIGPANENGAVAPAAPTAAAPIPAFFSSSRLLRRRPSSLDSFPGSFLTSDMHPPSSAECATGESGDESVQKRVVDEGQGDARDQDRGHDPWPVEQVAAD